MNGQDVQCAYILVPGEVTCLLLYMDTDSTGVMYSVGPGFELCLDAVSGQAVCLQNSISKLTGVSVSK